MSKVQGICCAGKKAAITWPWQIVIHFVYIYIYVCISFFYCKYTRTRGSFVEEALVLFI